MLTLCSRSSILYVRSRIFKKGGITMETLINRGYKFKIVPTKEQKEFFLQSFGCARKIYNMYVDELYRKPEESGYLNGLIKKSELHLSKYTDF